MRRDAATRIIATLGPASSDPAVIAALSEAGANVFRLNFSHGSHEDHQARYEAIRALEQQTGRSIGVLADLQGPKLRIATFADGKITLSPGQSFRLDLDLAPGDAARVGMPHPEIFAAIEAGQDLLVDDGKIRLRIERCDERSADTTVVTGGALSNRKGVNVPQAVLPLAALTDKDRRDLDFALQMGADWIALSFVQRPDDVAEAKKLVAGRAGVMIKMEKPQAIEHLDELIELADAVMLSAETASGAYPVEAVTIMEKIILRVERDELYRSLMMADPLTHEKTSSDAIAAAAAQVAETIDAAAIVTYTTSGLTALRVARERPSVRIIGLTASQATARRLALVWGVNCLTTRDCTSFGEMVEIACDVAAKHGFGGQMDKLVITAGVPFGTPGATNVLRVARIGG